MIRAFFCDFSLPSRFFNCRCRGLKFLMWKNEGSSRWKWNALRSLGMLLYRKCCDHTAIHIKDTKWLCFGTGLTLMQTPSVQVGRMKSRTVGQFLGGSTEKRHSTEVCHQRMQVHFVLARYLRRHCQAWWNGWDCDWQAVQRKPFLHDWPCHVHKECGVPIFLKHGSQLTAHCRVGMNWLHNGHVACSWVKTIT